MGTETPHRRALSMTCGVQGLTKGFSKGFTGDPMDEGFYRISFKGNPIITETCHNSAP